MKQMIVVIASVFLLFSQAYAEGKTRSQISSVPATERFEIIQSEIAVRMTYLLNVKTGATWQLSKNSKDEIFWAIVE